MLERLASLRVWLLAGMAITAAAAIAAGIAITGGVTQGIVAAGVIAVLLIGEAWLAYRQQMIHGLGYWLATIGVTRFQPTLQPHEVCVVNIERLSRAIDDLDTLTALEVR